VTVTLDARAAAASSNHYKTNLKYKPVKDQSQYSMVLEVGEEGELNGGGGGGGV